MGMAVADVTHFKLGSLFMHPFPTCCTMITYFFKQGRYSYRSKHFTVNTYDCVSSNWLK